ncbi:DUF2155 domain-containing protein [Rhodopila sp.]|uniref:DUF2155 domain-containing protein n=1 Tax=Rhodopila sp. TaxID=2480087 RepID=UPI002BA497DD|nr:DUF2155 domain-containing protein [Rhodopila sp.]HVZ10602.1 DUF2155 domain-containing protein [Rhodopila sp.]
MRLHHLLPPAVLTAALLAATLPWQGTAAQGRLTQAVTAPGTVTQGAMTQTQGNPPLQEQQDSLLPPSLRGLAPRSEPAPAVTAPPPAQTPGAPPGAPPAAGGAAPDAAGNAPPGGAPAPDMTPQVQWPNKWAPAGTARLQALDKVNAQVQPLTVKVGQTVTFETLSITVKSCVVRPPDQPADAAAFLDITDSHPDAPGFTGWVLANEPSVSMMQSPIYDIRVTGCS